MSLKELLPTVTQLSHQDKLRSIHFLLLAVAKEQGCNLESAEDRDLKNALLEQLSSTDGIVWSPQADSQAVQALSDMLAAAEGGDNA